jgi:DNA-binding beta-propeller fold protein YncE
MKLNSHIFLAAMVLFSASLLAQTPRIKFEVKGLYPEGTVFNPKKNVFYVSSVIDGTVGMVDMQGNYTRLYEDKSLKSTYGIKIDPKQNRLWVCVSDANYSNYSDSASFKKLGRLIALDLETGKKVADIELANLFKGKHFINDMVFDGSGNLYVTDAFSPVIYKVNAAGKASIFVNNDLFKGEDVGLNGIAYNPQGFLLVDDSRTGSVYKVDLANPKNIKKVNINNFFPGADGLIMQDANTLLLIQNQGVDKVFKIESTDNWATAKIKAATGGEDRFQHPSTGTIANGKVYVLNSKMNELADPTKKPSKEFSLQVAEFKPVP